MLLIVIAGIGISVLTIIVWVYFACKFPIESRYRSRVGRIDRDYGRRKRDS
jgi:hypothetical protein